MPKNDIETLKAWCHWKRIAIAKFDKEFTGRELRESELELVTAVENVISQVGTWKAKYEKLAAAQSTQVCKCGPDEECDACLADPSKRREKAQQEEKAPNTSHRVRCFIKQCQGECWERMEDG